MRTSVVPNDELGAMPRAAAESKWTSLEPAEDAEERVRDEVQASVDEKRNRGAISKRRVLRAALGWPGMGRRTPATTGRVCYYDVLASIRGGNLSCKFSVCPFSVVTRALMTSSPVGREGSVQMELHSAADTRRFLKGS